MLEIGRKMSEEVKKMENSKEIKDMKRPCEIIFYTRAGIYTLDVLQIVDIDLEQVKNVLQSLQNINANLKGNDIFRNILEYTLDSLIYMAKTIKEMKEGENLFYIDCLKELLVKKDNK